MRNLNFNHHVLAFLDIPHVPVDFEQKPQWFLVPVVGPQPPLIFPHRQTGLRSSVIICTETQKVLRFVGANMMLGKRVPNSMYQELIGQAIKTQPDQWHITKHVGGDIETHHRRWTLGEPFVDPSREYLSVYKLFRRITVKAAPSRGIPHEDETPAQGCDTC
jgi:hypothetical protein